MDSAKKPDTEAQAARVLAGGSPNGHRVELLELAEGRFAITCDGNPEAVYELGARNLESCIKSYLALLQSFEVDNTSPFQLRAEKIGGS